ncbi:MAG: cytochrome P450 [Gammaproteobacteria bacterium]|jgi:cytochrome P450
MEPLIPKGGLVVVWLSSANRDPAAFENTNQFMPDRTGPHRHLAFGLGVHLFLGAPLARVETQIGARAILEKTSSIVLEGQATLGQNASFENVT